MPMDLSANNYLPKQGLAPQEPVRLPMPDMSEYANQYSHLDSLSKASADIIKQRSEQDLGKYAVEAQSIIEETAGYATKREELLNAIAQEDPNNREALTKYYQDLSHLRNGEIQGALSPMVASARINSLTKSYINRRPAMALKIRQIHNGLLDDVSKVSGSSGNEEDPDEKAINALVEESVRTGIPVPNLININRYKMMDDVNKMSTEAMARTGTLNEAAISKSLDTSADAYYVEAIEHILQASKDPNFVGKDYRTALGTAKAEMIRRANKALTDVQLNNNLTLSREYQKAAVDNLTAPLDELIKIADTVDNPAIRAQLSKSLQEITENYDKAYFRKKLGPLATFAVNAQDLIVLVDEVSKVQKLGSHGLRKELETYGEIDLKTQIIAETLWGDNYSNIIARDLMNVSKGNEPESAENATIDRQRLQDALTLCTSPKLSNGQKEQYCSVLAKNPYSFEAFDKRKDLQRLLPNMPAVQNSLMEASPRQLMEPASKAGPTGIKNIQFDALNLAAPFSVGDVATYDAKLNQKPMNYNNPFSGMQFTNSSTKELVERLNQQYRVISMFTPRAQAQKWAGDTYSDLTAFAEEGEEGLLNSTKKDPTTTKTTESTKTGADGSRTDTKTVEVTEDSSLAAEARQAGMSPEEYKAWVNTPAQ